MTASTKLKLNEDGTVTVPIKGRDPVTLQEPTMRELAQIHTMLADADASFPPMPTLTGLGDNPTADEVRVYREELREYSKATAERQALTYGDADESPYGVAFIKIMEMLGESVTPDDLYGWAMSPSTGAAILKHFSAPLGGAESAALA